MKPNSQLPTASPTRTVVGYVRGSTEEQQNTLEVQENQIRAYCAYKNLELVKVFIDSGESGGSSFFERPAACDMLANLDALGATGIVITKLDRGFRNALDCLFTLDNLATRQIGLHLLDIQLEPDTPVGKLLVTMLAAIAEFENKRRSERQKDAFKVLKGNNKLCGTVPYGWTLNSQLLTLNPDPEEQRVLRQIVTWIETEKMPVSKIARNLNNAGTPTKNGGKKWFPATVASVYKHRRVAPEVRKAA